MSTLPKFQEPDWSTLPDEAVAWAVDEGGIPFGYNSVPVASDSQWANAAPFWTGLRFDMTNIDWRTTLRLRPTEEAPAVDLRPEIQALTESVEELNGVYRNEELERLAEEFMKALLANPSGPIQQSAMSGWDYCNCTPNTVACASFEAAAAFIAEREKRRNK